MVKRVMTLALAIISLIGVKANAQAPQLTPMPLNPKVVHGTLPNGLNYYIMHNEEPKERANFYIAQKVGSTLETPDQLGLAHFLEHMAFNGTTHYPGNTLLTYLQSKGIRFGADINAYTSFDETVYNIDNVPTTDVALMDSVLLALHDWSCEITLAEEEIDKERGVIQEEWRQRNNADTRMYTAILPDIYDEYQYEQMPIGKMDIVMNFKPEVLRAYYKKWYRPDQQGIVIVGDFDAKEMEQKVIELFSTIPMPENAAERVYPQVSDNEKLRYVTFSDPELQYPMARMSFKYDRMPFEFRNTVESYLNIDIMQRIIQMLINQRLTEYSQNPECPYAYAGTLFTNFYVSTTKGTFDVMAIGKDNIETAFESAMSIVARACKTGFTESELDRVRKELLNNYETQFNKRDKTASGILAQEIIRHFIDNEPAPGIEAEYELLKAVLPSLPVVAINQVAAALLTPTNEVLVVSQPSTAPNAIPAEEAMAGIINMTLNAEYEAYVDEVITEPLISKLPKKGKIKSTTENKNFGTTEMTLSNGAKVVVKKTDFSADEISMMAFREGGKRSYPAANAANVLAMEDAYDYSKLGNFDVNMLRKYLSGKTVSLSYSLGNVTDALVGSSSVKDLGTLLELIYASFTDLNEDQQSFDAQMSMARNMMLNQKNNPQFIFGKEVSETRYGKNPLYEQPSVELIDRINYPEAIKLLQQSFTNAADYTFIFSGNIDMETFIPLVEQYIATLPSKKKPSKVQDVTPITMARGEIVNEFQQPMETPAVMVFDIYSDTNVPYSVENAVKLNILGDILQNIYTATLREEEGGTYGASVSSSINPNTNEWLLVYTFQTNDEKKKALIDRADVELRKLLNEGANIEDFSKVKEAALKQYEIASRTNAYWTNNLLSALRGYDSITNHRSAIENLTLEDFNAFIKNLYNGKNRIQVIMDGVEIKK